MSEIEAVTQVAKGIGDYGVMVVITAVYITISLSMMIAIFRWFKSVIERLIAQQDEFRPIMDEVMENGRVIKLLADSLRPSALLQVKSISGTCFDLSIYKVCRIIKKVREENNIVDREATRTKIRTLLCNLHEDRNSRFDNTRYNGNTLTHYTSPEWIDWVAEVVEGEVYANSVNDSRTYTNVEAVYNRIKIDFYHKLSE